MTLGFPLFAFSDEMKQIGTICKQTKVCIVKSFFFATPGGAALAGPSGEACGSTSRLLANRRWVADCRFVIGVRVVGGG
jgi:hypothetical protein